MAPFVVYADFEALVKSTGQEQATRGDGSFDYETQTPCSVDYTIVSSSSNSSCYTSSNVRGLSEMVGGLDAAVREGSDGILL